MARLNKFERETILLTSEGDKQVSVYTFNHSYKKRLRALSEEYPDYYTRDERKNLAEGAEIYLIDKSLCTLTFRRPRSEEARNKARQRAKKNGFGNN
jgi:hypothetical protein